jgi:trehalose synthase
MGVHEVAVSPVPLPRLAALLDPDRTARMWEYQERSRLLLAGRTVWNVNSTAQGGGVAEMLRTLVAYGRGAGIDARWLVLEGTPDFYAVTKRLHNRVHGFVGDAGDLGEEASSLYSRLLLANLPAVAGRVRKGDVVLLHDPQTAGLAEPLRSLGAHVIWRCHIGVDVSNAHTDEAWSFLRDFLVPASEAFVFSRAQYAPSWVPREQLRVIAPSLDPFSPKNADLSAHDVKAMVGRVASADRDGQLPGDARVVLQVSRWDRLKDMAGVLRAFAGHMGQLPRGAHLVLAGPEPARVDDDPEGADVLAECRDLRDALEPQRRSRVHVWCLPMDDVAENARMVNALQRHAAVVVQKSLAEGFGLTVTEPMWKSRPVVASAVGGIQDQIIDGESGFLLRDPLDLTAFVELVGKVLADPARAALVGRAAHDRVREVFLADRHLIQYVDLFEALVR